MPKDEDIPLYRHAFDSPAFNARLEKKVQPDINAVKEEYWLDLCRRTGRSLEEVKEILKDHSSAEVEAALKKRDAARRDRSEFRGWLADWEDAAARREEEREAGLERSKCEQEV